MSSIDVKFSGEIFRKDFPVIIASNRGSAILRPVRLRYTALGFAAGTLVSRNTTDGWFDKYVDGAASGLGTANAILFEGHPAEDFDSTAATGSVIATAIFGGCVVYKDNLTGYDAAALADLKGVLFTDAAGVELLRF